MTLITGVPQAHGQLSAVLLDAVAEAWPEEQPPALTIEQRTALRAAARAASSDLTPALARVAARVGLTDVF